MSNFQIVAPCAEKHLPLMGKDEIIRQAGMVSLGLAQPLTQALFPNLYPMLSHWDEC